MSAKVRLGTQGWAYPDWIGTFYPPASKQEDYLPFYSRIFDTVEIDTTFYHPPKPAIVRSWEKRVPGEFRFAAKLPQRITHEAKLSHMADDVTAFVRALEPLGDKLGPLLVQLPAEFVRDEGNEGVLDRFLAAAPTREFRFAVELRHESWQTPATAERLRRRNVARVWAEWRDLPRATEITADFLYIRWLGDRREIETYDQVVIDRDASFSAWERDLRRVLPEVREVFGYFNNHWAGHSPASANEMKRRLGLQVTEPREQWTQRELW